MDVGPREWLDSDDQQYTIDTIFCSMSGFPVYAPPPDPTLH